MPVASGLARGAHPPVAKLHHRADDKVAVGRMQKDVEVFDYRVMFEPLQNCQVLVLTTTNSGIGLANTYDKALPARQSILADNMPGRRTHE